MCVLQSRVAIWKKEFHVSCFEDYEIEVTQQVMTSKPSHSVILGS